MNSVQQTVRPSAIAGTWYPGTAAGLRRTIESYLGKVRPATLPGRVLALVSPHAGYAYSGPTAAHAYAQVAGAPFRRVILFGPLHRPIWGSRLGSFMLPMEDAYRTPLGDVSIDRPFIARLGEQLAKVQPMCALTPVRGDEEHSLEIELPFLQVVLDQPSAGLRTGFHLVPIMFGDQIGEPGVSARLEALASALAALIGAEVQSGREETLLVASTDLSHLDSYEDVVRIDRRLVDLVAAFDVDGLSKALQSGQVQACGATGLVAMFRTAEELGARGAQVLDYATSGDVTGEKRPGVYTVGYLAAAVYA